MTAEDAQKMKDTLAVTQSKLTAYERLQGEYRRLLKFANAAEDGFCSVTVAQVPDGRPAGNICWQNGPMLSDPSRMTDKEAEELFEIVTKSVATYFLKKADEAQKRIQEL